VLTDQYVALVSDRRTTWTQNGKVIRQEDTDTKIRPGDSDLRESSHDYKLTELAIDCADPSGLARFCAALGYEAQDEDNWLITIGSQWRLMARTALAQYRQR